MSEENQINFSKYIPRSTRYGEHISIVLGVLDGHQNFDNEFQDYKLMMKFIMETQEAIEQGNIPLKKYGKMDLMPNAKAIKELDAIWNGRCFHAIIRNENHTRLIMRIFCFADPRIDASENLRIRKIMIKYLVDTTMNEIKMKILYSPSDFKINVFELSEETVNAVAQHYFDTTIDVTEFEEKVNQFMSEIEYVPLPKLRNMVPVQQLKEDTWGIQIREKGSLRYFWEGANYATVIEDGNFKHYTAEGIIPRIEPHDMYSLTKEAYVMHRPVYHFYMADMSYFFQKKSMIFINNMQKINKWMEEIDQIGMFANVENIMNEVKVEHVPAE